MNATDHEDLTRVGPGTVMGEFMRQYWLPAVASSELKADAPPMRLMLLSEKLIAFRDSSGRVGVLDHRCPHRCASLFLGRNEQNGVRCIYHGWKFDVDGQCLEMPNVPPAQDFKAKVKAKAYKVIERNGLIWVYMGSRATPPPMTMIEAAIVPEGELNVTFVQRDCNWMQSLEGDIDTSHGGFLHFGCLDPENIPEGHPLEHTTVRAPEYDVQDAPWGTTYGSFSKAQGGKSTYWRCANFMFPFWTQTPQGEFPINVNARAWVPIDDGHTMFVYLRWTKRPGYLAPLKDGKPLAGNTAAAEYLPNSTDWNGRWRLKANASNDWQIDREAQSNGTIFSGIVNIHLQDQAVTESMGPITDHAWEHLGPSDRMLARTRRRVLQAARKFRDTGHAPPGVDDPQVYLGARAGYFLTEPSVSWQDAYDSQLKTAIRPAGGEQSSNTKEIA
jgi:phthalate 4,5-dioxygenase